MTKPSELFVRAVNEECHRNGGNYDTAWNTCAHRTHSSIYNEMMRADTRQRTQFTNAEAAQRPVRITADPRAILDAHANDLAAFRVALTGPDWAAWVESNQGRFTGRAASTAFAEVVAKLLAASPKLSYHDAWTTAMRKFPMIHEGMSK